MRRCSSSIPWCNCQWSARTRPPPPATPISGESYIAPTGATGAWAGQDGALAVWQDTAWIFHAQKEGWTAWLADIDRQWSFDGTAWVETAPAETFQNIPMLGINTTADATNRLSVASPATLLDNEGAGHQLKINKNASADTASLLFQSGWTGYAEMGLAGANDFTIKTSDGTAWFSALKCNSADGRVSFPSGITGRVEVFDTGGSVFLGINAGLNDDLATRNNVFIGNEAGKANTSGAFGVGIGRHAIGAVTTGQRNVGIGVFATHSVTGTSGNVGVGGYALEYTTGGSNTGVGDLALRYNTTGTKNAALGTSALSFTTTGANNTTYSNCTGLGYNTRVSGDNQVQLGDSSTTTYAYGAVQDRSDRRDKADIRDTKLGLDFITRLRPVDFRWDMRDDYFDEVEEIDPETGEAVTRLVAAKKDGSRKRKRFHHGLIAQEVRDVIKATGVDFGGFQDHNYSGDGEDVLSIGYTELIAPLIRAVQEMATQIEDLKARIAG